MVAQYQQWFKIALNLKNNWRQFVHLVPPPVCMVCSATGEGGLDLCRRCRAELPWLSHACAQCASPIHSAGFRLCGSCLQKPPAFTRTIAAFEYAAPIRSLLQNLKFHNRLSHARVLGLLLGEIVAGSGHDADVIVPVPLHKDRLKERGYNQALEIAHWAGKVAERPMDQTLCRRELAGVAQMTLTADERRRNLKKAFVASSEVSGKRVAIVDDVMTTGATANEMARELLRKGAQDVQVWVVARALLKS